MGKSLQLLPAVALIAWGTLSQAATTDTVSINTDCGSHCVSVERVGAALLATWHGDGGNAVKHFKVDLPADAIAISTVHTSAQAPEANLHSAANGSVKVDYQTMAYQTDVESVIVTITEVYSAGQLIHVSAKDVRLPLVDTPDNV